MNPDATLTMLKLDLRDRGIGDSTAHEYQRMVRALLESITSYADLDRAAVADWVHGAKSDSSKRHRWLAVKALTRMLVAEDILTVDPCAKLSMPRDVAPPQPILSEDAYAALLATCDRSWLGRRDRAIITVLGSTGARRTELASLKLDDVDLDAGSIAIVKGKGGKSRRSWLDPVAVKATASYLAARQGFTEPRLWLNTRGKPMSPDGIRPMVERRAARAGIAHVTLHQFRRRLASRWLLAGGSESALMLTCGWTSTTMPGRYAAGALAEIAQREHGRIFGS